MNLDYAPAELAFREEVRAFFATNITDRLRALVRTGVRLEPAEYVAYQKCLASHGWGAPTWPRQYGGTGWTPTQYYIFESESAAADAPQQYHQGLELIGPIIFTYGSEAQKQRYLPAIISGDDWWCQGYSEPGAGSDLASLKTRAVRDGDHYVVTGQKIWTSYAHAATRMFCLARTEARPRRQEGISLLLIDMTAPGVRVRPIITLDERHHVNEVFLDDVRVPAVDLVGEEGKGWNYGKVLLDRERGLAAALGLRLGQYVRVVKDRAAQTRVGRMSLLETPGFRDKLAQIEIEMLALEVMGLRTLADTVAGVDSGPRASMLKIRWSELIQRITELWVESLGYHAACFAPVGNGAALPADMPYPVASYLHARVTTIYGGANAGPVGRTDRWISPLPPTRSCCATASTVSSPNTAISRCGAARAAGTPYDRAAWARMASLGWLGIVIPEAAGGLGFSAVETMLVMEGLGRALCRVPYAGTCVFAPALLPADSPILPAIVEGTAQVAPAIGEPAGRFDLAYVATTATQAASGWTLTGAKSFAPDGAAADWFIVPARSGGATHDPDGITLFLVRRDAPGLTVTAYRGPDHHHHAKLDLDGVPAIAISEPGEGLAPLEVAADRAIAAHLAEAVGSMETLRDMTLTYLKTREQFGATLGSFQALQHRMVDMALACEEARSMLYFATLRLDSPAAQRRRAVSAAKTRIGQTALHVAHQAVQLHGGVGTSDELAVSHHLKRLMVIETLYGNADHHRRQFADMVDQVA